MKKITTILLCSIVSWSFAQNQNIKYEDMKSYSQVKEKTETDQNTPYAKPKYKVAAAGIAIGQSPNGFGCAFGPLNPVSAHEGLNTIAVIHRSDFATNGDNGSGSFRYDISTDGGTNWTNNKGPIYNPIATNGVYPGPGRYPSAIVLNPKNASTATGAYLAYWSAARDHSNGTVWGGQLMATQKLDGTELKIRVDSSTQDGGHFIVSRSFWKASETVTFGVNMDNDQIANSYLDTVIITKGVWNNATDSLEYTHSYYNLPLGSNSNGDAVYGDERIAFGLNGQTGYVLVLGYSASYSTYGIYHPIIMKTSNGGTSWGVPLNIELDSLVESVQNKSLLQIFDDIDTGWKINNISTGFDGGLSVDKNGNPHILVNICPASISSPPPGATGSEFSIYTALNRMVDIYSTDGGATWKSMIVGSPQTFRGNFGTDPSNPDNTEDNRPHISRDATGSKIFFSWFDTNPVTWGVNDNNFPDLWVNMYDVDNATLPYGAQDMTGADINSSGILTYGNIAPEAWTNSVSSFSIHCVTQELDVNTNDFGLPTQYKYYKLLYPLTIGLEENVQVKAFSLGQNFPNPAKDFTTINMDVLVSGDYNVEVLNTMGQLVLTKDLGLLQTGTKYFSLNISGLTSGVYFYNVKTKGASLTKKMIID